MTPPQWRLHFLISKISVKYHQHDRRGHIWKSLGPWLRSCLQAFVPPGLCTLLQIPNISLPRSLQIFLKYLLLAVAFALIKLETHSSTLYLPSLPSLSSSPLTIPDTQYMHTFIFVTCLPPHEMISYRKTNIFAGVFHHCIHHP